jgi:hypothetical protein
MALILDVQLEILHLVDDIGQLPIGQAQEDAIVDVDNEYDITTIENAVINERLLEVDLLQFVNLITIPNLSSLFLTVQIGQELEDVVLGVSVLDVNALGKFHIHIHFDGSLRIGHNKVNLLK